MCVGKGKRKKSFNRSKSGELREIMIAAFEQLKTHVARVNAIIYGDDGLSDDIKRKGRSQ